MFPDPYLNFALYARYEVPDAVTTVAGRMFCSTVAPKMTIQEQDCTHPEHFSCYP